MLDFEPHQEPQFPDYTILSGQGVFTKSILAHFEAWQSLEHYTLNKYAALYDMNPKKIQRLLNDEGTSFSEIIDRYRAKKAKRLLHETDIPIKVIAKRLGYSSGQAFSTASKRWYGMSPRKIRKSRS